MSETYRGLPDVETFIAPSTLNILSSTNATPIIVTMTAAHGLTDLDLVWITGHTGNVNANGRWVAHVLSNTTFSLLRVRTHVNSVGSGVGGNDGTVLPMSWQTLETMPADTDNATAESVNSAFEGAFDRSAFVAGNLATTQYTHLEECVQANNTIFTIWSTTAAINVAYTEIADVTALLIDIDVLPFDDVLASFQFNTSFPAQVGGKPTAAAFAIFAHIHDYGVAGAFASASIVTGSQIELTYKAEVRAQRMEGRLPIPSGFRGKQVSFFLAAYYDDVTGGPYQLFLRGGFTFKAIIARKAF